MSRHAQHWTSGLILIACAATACADELLVPDDFPTIQQAIFAASDGDSVVIAPGIYNEAIDFGGKLITVRSTDPDDAGVVANTVIDAAGLNSSVVLCVSGETSAAALSGLTITGGTGSADNQGEIAGGGIRIFESSPTIDRCLFLGNTAIEDGAAVYIDQGSPTIVQCIFENNVAADDGGAIAIRGFGGMSLVECTFMRNAAIEDGGAIRIRSGGAEIQGCLFQLNEARDKSAAIDIDLNDATVTLVDNTFCGNDPDAIIGPFEGGGNNVIGSCDVDSDADGLLDFWETVGIPYIGVDGALRHYVLPEADPMHKTLYVELDHSIQVTFDQAAADAVEFAFAVAPVPNPDGVDGIDLFIDIDDTNLPFLGRVQTPNNDFPAEAALAKVTSFGTASERSDPDSVPILLLTKPLAYRYCVGFFEASSDIGGLGELGGDDSVIFIGNYSTIDQAAVFMHELGHNLSLEHGGGKGIADPDERSINGKPNYPSIMNYVLAYREPWNQTFWSLDYSRAELIPIEETDLSELDSVGVGGNGHYDDYFMPFFGHVTVGAPCFDADLHGQPIVSYADLDPAVLTDLNLDCDTDDDGFAGDLNFLEDAELPGTATPSPSEILRGHDDWANVVLPVNSAGGSFAGPTPTDELTNAQREIIRTLFPSPVCLADVNGDGSLNVLDFVAFQGAWQNETPLGDCNDDGAFDILDFVCFQYIFIQGCD